MSEAPLTPPAAKLAYSVKEVAALTPFGERTIYREIAEKRLVSRKRGSSTFILHEDLMAWLNGAPIANGESVQ
jgi:excisionase family DNA binding protein